MTTDQEIGAAIREAMFHKRITQTRLGAVLGIDQTTVSKKIHGKRPFLAAELFQVSAVLETPMSEILKGVKGYGCNAYPFGSTPLLSTAVAA